MVLIGGQNRAGAGATGKAAKVKTGAETMATATAPLFEKYRPRNDCDPERPETQCCLCLARKAIKQATE